MFRNALFALVFVSATAGAASAQTHTIEVWGAHLDVPDQGTGGLFGSAIPSANAGNVTGSIGQSATDRQGRFHAAPGHRIAR